MDLDILQTGAEQEEEPVRNFATVSAVFADGLTLLFDGEDQPSEKHYRCNTSVFFQPGDRVRIFPDSGTYVVEYVVGAPMQEQIVGLPGGGAKNQVLTKVDAEDFAVDWQTPRYVPADGTTGYVLTKTASGATFQAAPSSLPSGGSTGQVLKKTSNGAEWADETQALPSGGSTGQVLTKTSSGSSWSDAQVRATSGTTVIFRNNGASLGISFNGGSTWYYCLFD